MHHDKVNTAFCDFLLKCDSLQASPACDVVEDRVAVLGGASLVEDVEGLQGFELIFLMDLVPRNQGQTDNRILLNQLHSPTAGILSVLEHFTD